MSEKSKQKKIKCNHSFLQSPMQLGNPRSSLQKKWMTFWITAGASNLYGMNEFGAEDRFFWLSKLKVEIKSSMLIKHQHRQYCLGNQQQPLTVFWSSWSILVEKDPAKATRKGYEWQKAHQYACMPKTKLRRAMTGKKLIDMPVCPR